MKARNTFHHYYFKHGDLKSNSVRGSLLWSDVKSSWTFFCRSFKELNICFSSVWVLVSFGGICLHWSLQFCMLRRPVILQALALKMQPSAFQEHLPPAICYPCKALGPGTSEPNQWIVLQNAKAVKMEDQHHSVIGRLKSQRIFNEIRHQKNAASTG